MKGSLAQFPLHSLSGKRFHLNSNNFKSSGGDAHCRRVNALNHQVLLGSLGHVFQPKQRVWCRSKCTRNPNERGKVRLAITTHVVRIAPLAQPASARRLCIGYPEFVGPDFEILTERFHRNVLFGYSLACHERFALMMQTNSVIFLIKT